MKRWDRRRMLAAVGGLGSASLAGCLRLTGTGDETTSAARAGGTDPDESADTPDEHTGTEPSRTTGSTDTPPTIVPESGWSQFQAGSGHTGHAARAEVPSETPSVVWKMDPEDTARGGIVASAEHLIKSTRVGIMAIEKTTGSVAWKSDDTVVDEYFLSSDPVVHGDAVIFGGGNKRTGSEELTALEAGTGEKRWTVEVTTEDEFFHGLTATEGTLYLLRRNNDTDVPSLSAVSLDNREIRWTREIDRYANVNRPVAANDALVVLGGYDPDDGSGGVLALEASSGSVQWERLVGGTQMPPTISGDTVYVTPDRVDSDTPLVALDLHTGEDLWRFESRNGFYSSPAVTSDHVYFGLGDTLYAVSVEDGTPQWKHRIERHVDSSSPVVIGDTVLIGDKDFDHETAYVNAHDAETGDQLWAKPVDEGDVVDVIGVDGAVFAKGQTFQGDDSQTIMALV